VLFFAAPYIAAELGFFLDGVPLLGWRIFQTGAIAGAWQRQSSRRGPPGTITGSTVSASR
jgi:hypothetical protein